MSDPLIMVKKPQDVREAVVAFTDVLKSGEHINAGAITYTSEGSIAAHMTGSTLDRVIFNVSGGDDKHSYGIVVTINTNYGHVLSKTLSVVVNQDQEFEFQNKNFDAFNDMVGELQAGDAAIGQASFLFPTPFDANGGRVSWELIDRDGVVYSSGVAHDYAHEQIIANQIRVTARAVINSPSDMVPTLQGQNYQIRWLLQVHGQKFWLSETLVISGPNTVPVGVEDVVEMENNDITVSVVFESPFENVGLEVYHQNEKRIESVGAAKWTKTPDGYLYVGTIQNPLNLPASLDAYTIVWSAWNNDQPNLKTRQVGRVFIVNASLMSATEDTRVMVNKSRSTIAGAPDVLFSIPLLLAYLRRGKDAFNGAYGVLTGFTMLNASGSIREFWLKFSEVLALRAQFLAEGEKVFNFSGQAISLDIDRTQFYSQLADNLQQIIDSEAKSFKQNLTIKGIITGDGNMGLDGGTAQRHGALGALGITLTPATGWGKFVARYGIR